MIYFYEWNIITDVWNTAVVQCFFLICLWTALVHDKRNILPRHLSRKRGILSISPSFFLRGYQHNNRNKGHSLCVDKEANFLLHRHFTWVSRHNGFSQVPPSAPYISFLEDYCHWARCCQGQSKSRWYFEQQSCHGKLAREDMSQTEANLMRSQNNLRKLHSSHRT